MELPRARHPFDLVAVRRVLDGNQRELAEWIEALESDPALSGSLVEDRAASQRWHDELLRRLFNWSSSANALVEHTRAVMADFPSWQEPWDRKRRELVDVELASFVSRLRAVLHHSDTIPVSIARRFNDSRNVVTTEVVIDRGLLMLTPADWTSASRSYIERQELTFSLGVVVQQYHNQVTMLYSWLDGYIEERRRSRREESAQAQSGAPSGGQGESEHGPAIGINSSGPPVL